MLRKPDYLNPISVILLCSPACTYLYFSLQSKDKSSPAWALAAMSAYVSFASLPVAVVISLVATLRRRGEVWSRLAVWVLTAISILFIFLVSPVSPWV